MGMDPQFQELEFRLGKRFDTIDDRLVDIESRMDVFAWTLAVFEREGHLPTSEPPEKVTAKKARRRR